MKGNMKIAIPVETEKKEDNISDIFGRSKLLAFYDQETQKLEFLDNPGDGQARGAGIAAAQFLVNQKVDKVYLTNIGPNARNVLNQADIQIKEIGVRPLEELLK